MKRVSHLVLSFLLPLVVVCCSDDDTTHDTSVPEISNVSRDISLPKPDEDVAVSATVTTPEGSPLISVALKLSVDDVNLSDITMSADGSGNVYSGTIPAQKDGAVVVYTVVATNKNGSSDVSDTYTVTADEIPFDGDYSKLVLNEVSGVGGDAEKFYELFNTGTVDIPLEGCKIYYNANGSVGGVFPPDGNQGLTWTGSATQVIKAGALFSLIGRNNPGSFTTGLTAQRILIITLEDPDGNVIDRCVRAEDTGDYAFTDKSFSRIPDGTGAFYFTAPTPDAWNGASADGLVLVPQEPVEIELPSDVDYTHLVLNEISGEHKFVEIYNSGDEDISLAGVRLQRNNGQSQWVGGTTDVIPAGAYRLFLFNSFTEGLDNNPAYTGWTVSSGISDQQILKVAIVDPAGEPVSVFIRGEAPLPDWGTGGAERERNYSYSRMSDGAWAYAEPTPGAENAAKVKEIVNPGYLTAQP